MQVTRIDHVAIAVNDLEEALGFFRDSLGLQVTRTDIEDGQGVRIAFMPLGDSEIEVIQPVVADSGVVKYLEKRGPGIHHLCLEVSDLDAALAQLKARGVQLINEEAYTTNYGRRIAFVHPKSAYGVLIELYETLPATDPVAS